MVGIVSHLELSATSFVTLLEKRKKIVTYRKFFEHVPNPVTTANDWTASSCTVSVVADPVARCRCNFSRKQRTVAATVGAEGLLLIVS